eukprot:2376233-Ditylum_brightwellii.AAC.1
MVTNTSLPHSTLKRCVSVNNYHRVREAVACDVASIAHCDTKYNLADMGTKALNGVTHQFLLQNQQFPPVSTAGECKMEPEVQSGSPASSMAKYNYTVLSPMDEEIVRLFYNNKFISHLTRFVELKI